MSEPEGGRRRFVLGALGIGAFTVAGGLNALVASAADKPAPAPAPPEEKPPEISEEARALHAVLVARWGKELDEAQKQGLLEAIENNVQNGKTLRGKSLMNGQEPPTVFYVTPPAPR